MRINFTRRWHEGIENTRCILGVLGKEGRKGRGIPLAWQLEEKENGEENK